jgi:hypothetical protein
LIWLLTSSIAAATGWRLTLYFFTTTGRKIRTFVPLSPRFTDSAGMSVVLH